MYVVESWKRAINRGENVGALMMDLSKAFDCMSNELLIGKRSASGFSNNAYDFILNYLSNHQQIVKIGHFFRSWIDFKRGVQQGSILGPQL